MIKRKNDTLSKMSQIQIWMRRIEVGNDDGRGITLREKTALEVLQTAFGDDGWDEDSMLIMACDFIDAHDLKVEFEGFVRTELGTEEEEE